MKITIGIITARRDCKLEWTIDSLMNQVRPDDEINVILVDHYHGERSFEYGPWFSHVPVKPNVWSGKHKLTRQEWWSVASGRNTILCLAKTEWVAVADDRSVLGPQWLDAIRGAQAGNYVVAGTYEKLHNVEVEFGVIKSAVEPVNDKGHFVGKDHRATGEMKPRRCPGIHLFGCTSAYPLEWALDIGGYDEDSNGLGLEDCAFGEMMERANRPIFFDERMKLWEDRTPGKIEVATVRSDYGKSPNDKSHAYLKRYRAKMKATHDFDIREHRRIVQETGSFPIPTTPTHDWYLGIPLSEMVPQ